MNRLGPPLDPSTSRPLDPSTSRNTQNRPGRRGRRLRALRGLRHADPRARERREQEVLRDRRAAVPVPGREPRRGHQRRRVRCGVCPVL